MLRCSLQLPGFQQPGRHRLTFGLRQQVGGQSGQQVAARQRRQPVQIRGLDPAQILWAARPKNGDAFAHDGQIIRTSVRQTAQAGPGQIRITMHPQRLDQRQALVGGQAVAVMRRNQRFATIHPELKLMGWQQDGQLELAAKTQTGRGLGQHIRQQLVLGQCAQTAHRQLIAGQMIRKPRQQTGNMRESPAKIQSGKVFLTLCLRNTGVIGVPRHQSAKPRGGRGPLTRPEQRLCHQKPGCRNRGFGDWVPVAQRHNRVEPAQSEQQARQFQKRAGTVRGDMPRMGQGHHRSRALTQLMQAIGPNDQGRSRVWGGLQHLISLGQSLVIRFHCKQLQGQPQPGRDKSRIFFDQRLQAVPGRIRPCNAVQGLRMPQRRQFMIRRHKAGRLPMQMGQRKVTCIREPGCQGDQLGQRGSRVDDRFRQRTRVSTSDLPPLQFHARAVLHRRIPIRRGPCHV